MKKRLLAILLSLMMILSLLPVGVFAGDAESTKVAEVGGKQYTTLAEAVEKAAAGETITLLKDVTLDSALTITKSVTIDGTKDGMSGKNGEGCFTVSVSTADSGRVFNLDNTTVANSEVNFKNIRVVGPMGAVGNTRGISAYKTSGVTLNLENTYVSASCYAVNIAGDNTDLKLNVKDSCLEGWCAFQLWSPAKVNVTGSELIGTNQYVSDNVYSFATIVVNQCSVASEITVTDSTVKAISHTSKDTPQEILSIQNIQNTGSQAYPNGNQIIFTNCEVSAEGSWKDDDGKTVALTPLYYAVGSNTISINGKNFFVPAYGEEVSDELIATAEIVRDGKTVTYGSVYTAISDAKDNETITLLKDVTLDKTLVINNGKKFVLNLNEKTLTATLYLRSAFVTATNGTISGDVWLETTNTDIAYNSFTLAEDAKINTVGYGVVVTQIAKGAANYGSAVDIQGSVTGKESALWVLGNITTDLQTAQNPVTVNVGPKAKLINNDQTKTALQMAGACVVTIADGAQVTGGTAIEVRAGKLTVNGGTITGTGVPTTVQPNGDGTSTTGAGIGIAQHTTKQPINVTVSNGKISGYTAFFESNPQKNDETAQAGITLNIAGGYFAATNGGKNAVSSESGKTGFISGGYFTSAPNASYLAESKAVLTSTEPGYAFMVGDKPNVDVKPVAGDPVANVDKIKENNRDTVKAVAESIDDNGALAAAATQETGNVTDAQKKSAENAIKATNSGVTVGESDTVTVYAQTYLDVTATAYDATKGTITLDIQPMSRIVATTAGSASEIKVKGETANGETPNAVVLANSEKKISIQTMTISIELPDGFTDEIKVYVQHRGYEYEAAVTTEGSGKKIATFTNPHGFSEFTISAASTAVAKVNGASYTTLQAAVDAAKDGETVEIVGGTSPYSATMSGSSCTIKVENGTTAAIDVTINGTTKAIEKDKTEDFTYTAPVYTSAPITKKDVKFDDVDVNAYYAPAVKWAVENKITAGKTDKLFAPDDTCTRGEMITFLWNAAGKPAAKNTTNPFTDVNAGAFYYDAVLWAVSNGITSGTSETTFSPDNTVSRAQVVAFLYNYANKPAAANSTFSDVAADAYYAPAVGWAAAQKITSGTGNNTFSPENDCTRAQIVTFLYNDLAK